MTPEKVKLVQDSFEKVVPIASTAADIFYDRLFEVAPEVRPMFSADMGRQKEALMATLATAVKSLDNPDAIVPVLQKLGRAHVGYGVKDSHYDTVGGALLFTLEKGLGDDWNSELEEAWTETYSLVSTTMKDAAAEVPVKKKGLLARILG